MAQHPDKTFIGRIEKGLDFLGDHFAPQDLGIAHKTFERFIERVIQLYEQEPGGLLDSSRLREYVNKWCGWVQTGIS